MPLTSDRDRADEMQSGRKAGKRVPTWMAVLLLVLIGVGICLAGYFALQLMW